MPPAVVAPGPSVPEAGLRYPEVLRGRGPLVAVFGILLGVTSFMLLSTAVAQGLVFAGWRLGLTPGADFVSAYRAASSFETPWGMLAIHLGLAVLIPLSLALVRVVHQARPAYLLSVRPGFRWGYLAASAGVALVVLNVVLAASTGFAIGELRPQADFAVFLVVIVLTSPLQAAAEEFFFRGYLLQAFGSMTRTPWFGIVASAALFALFHGTQNVPLFLDRFGFGLLAAVLVTRTGGLEAAIGAHVVNNVLAFAYAGLVSTIAEVKAVQQVGWIDLAWDLAGFAVYTLAAIWLARRWGLQTLTAGSV